MAGRNGYGGSMTLGESAADMNRAMTRRRLGGGNVLTNDFSFAYPFDFPLIPNGSEVAVQQTIDEGSDFVVREQASSFRLHESTTPTGLVVGSKLIRTPQMAGYAAGELLQADIGMLSVLITATNRPWMADFLPMDQISGDAAYPYVNHTEIWVSNKTTITVKVRNNLPAIGDAAAPAVRGTFTLLGTYMSDKE